MTPTFSYGYSVLEAYRSVREVMNWWGGRWRGRGDQNVAESLCYYPMSGVELMLSTLKYRSSL